MLGHHAQRPHPSPTPEPLAGRAQRSCPHRVGHTHVGVCLHAWLAIDRGRRRARPQLQTTRGCALLCPGLGGLSRAAGTRQSDLGFGHALTRKLAPQPPQQRIRASRPLHAPAHAFPSRPRGSTLGAARGHEPPALQNGVLQPSARRDARARQPGRANTGSAQPPRLRTRAALHRLRLEK